MSQIVDGLVLGDLGFAGAFGLSLVVAVAKHDRCADERKLFADFAFEEAFVRPVE